MSVPYNTIILQTKDCQGALYYSNPLTMCMPQCEVNSSSGCRREKVSYVRILGGGKIMIMIFCSKGIVCIQKRPVACENEPHR